MKKRLGELCPDQLVTRPVLSSEQESVSLKLRTIGRVISLKDCRLGGEDKLAVM